jgi:hypothetical protein
MSSARHYKKQPMSGCFFCLIAIAFVGLFLTWTGTRNGFHFS